MRRALVCLFFFLLATIAPTPMASASADENPPVLESLTVTPALVDARTEPAEVTFEARITDDSSGYEFGYVSTHETSKDVAFTRVSGTPADGIYRTTIPWDSYDADGDIHFSVIVLDAAGKTHAYGSADLIAAGMPDHLTNDNLSRSPCAPTAAKAVRGSGSANVSWEPPIDDRGSPVTSYTVTSYPDGITQTVDATQTTATMTGLTNGTSYRFRVTATSAIGTSTRSSATNPVVLGAKPGAPTNARAAKGDQSATVTWTAPTSDGGAPITSYKVTSYPDGVTQTVDATQTTATVTGLINGTTYRFRVTATNRLGTSTSSVVTNAVIPSATAALLGAHT